MTGWHYLLLGGLLEVVWAISAKARPWWTFYISIGAGAGSVSCLYAALETMPIGTAYAVWTGIGAAGSALVGIALFGESTSALRLVFPWRSNSRVDWNWALKPVRDGSLLAVARKPCLITSRHLWRSRKFLAQLSQYIKAFLVIWRLA